MNKATLKNILITLNPGDIIDVAFNAEKAPLSGQYKVLSSKTGRGKNGSRIASIESMADHSVISIGTPLNGELAGITYNNIQHGFEPPTAKMPFEAQHDVAKATSFKEKLRGLVGYSGRLLRVMSTKVTEFNGVFTLEDALLSKGRYGQIHLRLRNNDTQEIIELWSYRHADDIDSIDILD